MAPATAPRTDAVADCAADGSGTRLRLALREAVLRAALLRRAVLDCGTAVAFVEDDRLGTDRLAADRLAADRAADFERARMAGFLVVLVVRLAADGRFPPDAFFAEDRVAGLFLREARLAADFFPVTLFAT